MAKRTLPSFHQLWLSYPSETSPCDQTNRDGTSAWKNQCAIRLSLALEGAGFALDQYTEPKCRHGHARGAESLASYLWRQVNPPRRKQTKTGVTGKNGIVFFKDIAGFRGGIGDHIDLWNGVRTKTGEYFAEAKETWFWEVS